ncbi:actin-like ATPase domain-containing protein [Hesseltinella vesiculosa]|uniref:glycerol kinase n=1 Tax=Hesseltinella vesiculosa TaxID=101127 RepID=A0A1X2GN60_9FUNG|nr:actin-like ATPase domain-containing protein [Hesseltinella vesiculosa]
MQHALLKIEAAGYQASDLACVGITNQRESIVTWDKLTGEPLHPAILWSDARTSSTVHELVEKANGDANVLVPLTGLPLNTYFTAVKLRWLLDHVPAVAQARDQGRLLFGTMDSWIIYNLTGGAGKGIVATDVTNASRTMLMNIHTLQWSQEAISFFGFEGIDLPKLQSSSHSFGSICTQDGYDGVPITGCLGDQQAAMVGQKCFNPGDAKSTFGTGCFMLFNTGDRPVMDAQGLLSTVAYQFGDDKAYALEGSVAVAGSSLNWLRDNLRVVRDAQQVNELASQVEDCGGAYFVTAFAGLFAPYWREDARGTICGLTQFTRLEHLCRATLEAVCYQTKAILDVMNNVSGQPLRILKVDGGMSNSDLCMQIQADVLGIEVDRPLMRESTALGAAIAAGLGAGIWSSVHDLQKVNQQGRTIFEAKISQDKRDQMYQGWQKAVQSAYGWSLPTPVAATC